MLPDALTDQRYRVDPGPLQVTHALLAHMPGKTRDVMADPPDQLPAISPAGAPADAPGFQEDHRQAALGQFNRGVDAGKAAADHTHIGAQVLGQRRALGHGIGRRQVIGTGMVLGLIHRLDFTLLQARVITRMMAGLGVVEMYSLSSTSWGGYTSGLFTSSGAMKVFAARLALA